MFQRCTINSGRDTCSGGRRGNTIVLVVGILVLLVIIATSYVTRTHAGRVTAVSLQGASLRDDNARVIAESIAGEIAGALFVRPIGGVIGAGAIPDSNVQRLSPRPLDLYGNPGFDYFPVRYGVDLRAPWNFAPYQVVPITNWPDFRLGSPLVWPEGPGNPNPGTDPDLVPEGNQLGDPGFGDARWLADTEPVRLRIGPGLNGVLGDEDDIWIFTHWRHMTNLSRYGNGWRICRDISDVGNLFTWGGIVGDLNIPVEQFLSARTDAFDVATGLPSLVDAVEFRDRWRFWFSSLANYNVAYVDPAQIPPNFLHLRDLNGNNFHHDVGERPQDEFIGPSPAMPAGMARWNAGRYLADTDGDGFTDSFWFLAPTMTERGIRQIAAVRIVDNGAMLNVNVAGRFLPRDELLPARPARTRGTTPADLALVGQLAPFSPVDWNVGFYDNRDHEFVLANGLPLWFRHLDAVGLWKYTSADGFLFPLSPDQVFRSDYWRRQGIRPLGADPRATYTPFGVPDEIELRMFHGNNYPWIFSRLEGTTEISANAGIMGPLRGILGERGSSEYLEQLPNGLLLLDSRRKLTTYNGARNDIMPPWLWPSPFPVDWDDNGSVDPPEVDQYFADMRKYDLRRPVFVPGGFVIEDVDGDGTTGLDETNLAVDDDLDEFDGDLLITKRDHLLRIRNYLDSALIVHDPVTVTDDQSYFGIGETATIETQKMAAAMAANIDAYRDKDSDLKVSEAVEVVEQTGVPPGTVRYLGLEAQPFLVEAVIAHVHAGIEAQADHPNVIEGHYVLCYTGPGDARQGSIVVVQIANPFDREINLSDVRISVFGQELILATLPMNMFLAPNTARTFVAMRMSGGGPSPDLIDVTGWREVLELTPIGVSDLIDVSGMGAWSVTREFYDDASENNAIELLRIDPDTNTPVLVDRIDIKPGLPGQPTDNVSFSIPFDCEYRKLGRVVTDFAVRAGLVDLPFTACEETGQDMDWPDVIPIGPFSHWVQWVRASRPWVQQIDLDGEEMQDDRKNPRYVFSRAFVDARSSTGASFDYSPELLSNAFGGDDGSMKLAHFASKDKQVCNASFGPDLINTQLQFSMQMLQKDADFEQVGELLNVWLFGHEIRVDNVTELYQETTATFSERMWEEIFDDAPNSSRYSTDEQRRGVNRLRVKPVLQTGALVGLATDDPRDFRHAIPNLPAGARVLDAFVCDGYGLDELFDLNNPIDVQDAELRRLKNANEFTGRMTPGLININTATPEVMRSLPHMARLVGLGQTDPTTGQQGNVQFTPRVHVAEAAVGYRDRIGPPLFGTLKLVPNYKIRNGIVAGLRVDRGFASIGEVLLLTKETADPLNATDPKSWRIDFAAEDPFMVAPVPSTRLSTDVVDVPPDPTGYPAVPDEVAGDAEEANLLFAGMSNMITTRSDVFTVYFKIRSFRQNPVTGRWDATDPEYIVDDSRYVMLVDRSEVNVPTDKPKIVYLEKLPK